MSFSKDRIQALQGELKKSKNHAICVRDTSNIEWLTGFEGVFDEEQAHTMFVPAKGSAVYLHTDSRYVTACRGEAEGTPVRVDAKRKDFSEWALKRWKKSGAKKKFKLAIENSMSLAEYRSLEKAFRTNCFHETRDIILKLRAVKDGSEIAKLKAAQAITDEAFTIVCDIIKPGMTEQEVRLELESLMFRLGADALAFPSIVACGANGASPHAQPGQTKLEAGMCIVMDFGAKLNGYCSDMTRTVFLGQPEGKMLSAWETILRANEEVQAMLKPGVTGAEAHALAEQILEEGGFAGKMGHGLGHGVGLQIHELPVLNPRNANPLKPGNVVTVEPGIYLPGEFGMRLEDFGVVTESGFERFTKSTHDFVVL